MTAEFKTIEKLEWEQKDMPESTERKIVGFTVERAEWVRPLSREFHLKTTSISYGLNVYNILSFQSGLDIRTHWNV
ncbi:hypothetical protein EAF00_007392 [Botryotinia globosa]|nr:hypothetical protein EAF00_007392 [Botryotinia globosa]